MRPLLLKTGQRILNHTTLHIIVQLVNIYKYMINSIWKEERSADKKNILSWCLIKVMEEMAGWLNWTILTSYCLPVFSQFSSVQSISHIRLFATPWIAALQASLSITNSWSSPRLTSIESVMPSSHLILCCLLLLLAPIPPSIRVFSNESTLHMRWPKYWSFSFRIIPSKEIPGLISFRMDWLDLRRV